MNPTHYENDHSRLLQKLSHDADAQAAKATRYTSLLTEARAASADAETGFFRALSQDALTEFALAKRWEDDVALAVKAIENCGGAEQIRARYLDTPTVYSTFAQGFGERASVLNRLIPAARKRFSARVAELAEQTMNPRAAETDTRAGELWAYVSRLEGELATAVFGQSYSQRREGHEHRSFETLYKQLTTPLPTEPAA